jgi:spore maturation protein CgeB
MAVKLLKASSCYPGYLRWFYREHPGLRLASYAEQYAALMDDCFSCSDSWKVHLEGTGHYAVEELIVNAEPLQKRWALEHKVAYGESTWLRDIFLAQYHRFSPQILYAHSREIAFGLKDRLKAQSNGKLFVICYEGAGLHDLRLAEHCDLMLTCVEQSVARYTACGVRTHLMPWGFDDRILSRLKPFAHTPAVSFVGSVAGAGHHERAFFLASIRRRMPADYWLSNLQSGNQWFRLMAWNLLHGKWEWAAQLPRFWMATRYLRKINRGELFGLEMLSALAASKMTLNVHISGAGDQAANIRLFEATGVGTCLVTDWKSNLSKLYEPDREVVTFRSVAEAAEKIRYLLDHDQERQALAKRGQDRTLAQHLYRDRVKEVGATIQTMF